MSIGINCVVHARHGCVHVAEHEDGLWSSSISRECNGVCVAVTCFSGAVSVVRRTLMGGFPLGENDVTSP